MPEAKLGELSLPLAPMLGCFGVAPAGGQAISTATSAEHGGNMDYRGFDRRRHRLLPGVGSRRADLCRRRSRGAGRRRDRRHRHRDLHGRAVSRAAAERQAITWPRGENADYIFTVGNARPLDQCVQHATTEMLRWLTHDYGLDPIGASTLLGQCVEYDLANIFDPAYTMVCKVPKRILNRLKP